MKSWQIVPSQTLTMFREIIICFLLVLLHEKSCASKKTIDCRDVSYRFVPYKNGEMPKCRIESPNKGIAVGMPSPLQNKAGIWVQIKYHQRMKDVRVLCSYYREAFVWKPYTKKPSLQTASKEVTPQDRLAADGYPFWFGWVIKGKTTHFLGMDCKLTWKERAPIVKSVTAGFRWKKFTLSKYPKDAVIGGYDRGQKFYVGLVTYQRRVYLAKIMKWMTWLLIVLGDYTPTYITSARHIKILTTDNQDNVKWEPVSKKKDRLDENVEYIYRCKPEYEYLVVTNLRACRGTKAEKLVYKTLVGYQ